jgi:hypothetical protein
MDTRNRRGRAAHPTLMTHMGRALAAAVGAALAVGGLLACARAGEPGPGGVDPIVFPPGQPTLVAWYEVGGGFVPRSWSLMEGPRLVVYSDGRAVADSRRVLVLPADEVAEFIRATRADLKGLDRTVDVGAAHQIADAPTTRMTVYTGDAGLQSVSAYALGETMGYPPRLLDARDRMEALAKRVGDEGSPYSSDRLRIVLEPLVDREATVTEWPAAVPLPPLLEGGGKAGVGLRTAVLTGDDAAGVARALPDAWRSGYPWPIVRLPDGTRYGVAWRYLLPDEKTRD